jgi:hypothetical protein
MKTRKPKDIGETFAEDRLIDAAVAAGAREAVRRHPQAGLPLVTWRDGKVVWVRADALNGKGEPLRRKRGQAGIEEGGSAAPDRLAGPVNRSFLSRGTGSKG